jgi:hypothetical protein
VLGLKVMAETRERFEREYGCTEAEWRAWMPGATAGAVASLPPGTQSLQLAVGGGTLRLDWFELPVRRIALLRLPRLAVGFVFSGTSVDERRAFLRGFDLHLQRGGG